MRTSPENPAELHGIHGPPPYDDAIMLEQLQIAVGVDIFRVGLRDCLSYHGGDDLPCHGGDAFLRHVEVETRPMCRGVCVPQREVAGWSDAGSLQIFLRDEMRHNSLHLVMTCGFEISFPFRGGEAHRTSQTMLFSPTSTRRYAREPTSLSSPHHLAPPTVLRGAKRKNSSVVTTTNLGAGDDL